MIKVIKSLNLAVLNDLTEQEGCYICESFLWAPAEGSLRFTVSKWAAVQRASAEHISEAGTGQLDQWSDNEQDKQGLEFMPGQFKDFPGPVRGFVKEKKIFFSP